MKWLLLPILVYTLPVFAQVFVETNIKVGMQINGNYISKSGGFMGIGEKENNESYSHFHYAHLANGRYTTNQNLTYDVKGIASLPFSIDDHLEKLKPLEEKYQRCLTAQAAQKEKLSQQSSARTNKVKQEHTVICIKPDTSTEALFPLFNKRQLINPRTTKINIHFAEIEDGKQVQISLSDKQIHKTYDFGGRHTAKYHNDTIKGNIRIGLTMPENTWAIIIKRKNMQGVFSGQLPKAKVEAGISNSFNRSVTHAGLGEFIVWGKPGTEITQDIVFDSYAQGSNVEGSIELEFQFINLADFNKVSTTTIIKSINDTSAHLTDIRDLKSLLKALKPILYLHNRTERITSLISHFSTNEILDFVKALNNIAYNADMNAYRWDIKAGASILAHEIALRLLQEISVFCKRIEIELPYTKKSANVLGLNAASYVIDRAKLRVQYASFEPFNTLLSQLEKFEKDGITYAQVRNTETLFKPFYESYQLLVNTVDMRYSIYSSVQQEVNWVFSQFGSLGAPGKNNQDIIAFAESMQNQDIKFYDELVSKLREFQSNNTTRVSAGNLRKTLDQLIDNNITLFQYLHEQVRAGQSDSESLQTSVMKLVMFNVMIFTQELSYKSFEEFRAAYFDPKRVNPILDSVNACVGLQK